MHAVTYPHEVDFGDGQFKIIIEALVSPVEYLPNYAEYELRYIARDNGICADVKSEAWNSDFKALIEAFEAILKEFQPGASRKVEFSHGVFSIAIETGSHGPINLLISLRPDPYFNTTFTFEMTIQQEHVKHLIHEINVLV